MMTFRLLPQANRFAALLLVALTFLWGATAFAAEDPLRLSLLNAAAKGGSDAHGTLNDFLKKSDDIKTTPQDEIWAYAKKEFDLSEKDFRSTALREQNEANFRKLMKELDIEAMLILDVFSKGKKFQLVVIGPSGKQVADIRRDVSRGRISKDDAKGILRDAFKELVPSVREFRDAGGWDAVAEEPVEEEEVSLMPEEGAEETGEETGEGEESEEELSLKEKALQKHEKKFSALTPGARLQAGLLIGKRSLTMRSAQGFELTHASPFAGFGAKVDAIFTQIGADSALGATLFGGYAPFTTIFAESQTYPSQYARLGLELRFLKGFSETFLLQVFAGGEATSITIDSNPFYTGNRYVSARAGVGILYSVGPVRLELGAALLPVLSVNNSDGAFGDTEGISLGIEPFGGLSFNITDDISAMLRYSGQFYSVDYPAPVVLADPAESGDVIHTGMVAIGYSL